MSAEMDDMQLAQAIASVVTESVKEHLRFERAGVSSSMNPGAEYTVFSVVEAVRAAGWAPVRHEVK
jgi:3-oxoacyl-(acyl-carrier-protein) synthase